MILRSACSVLLLSIGVLGCGDDSAPPADGSSSGSDTNTSSTTNTTNPPPPPGTSTGSVDSTTGSPPETTTGPATSSSSGGDDTSSGGGESTSSGGGESTSSGGGESTSSGGESTGSTGGSTGADPCAAGDGPDFMVDNVGALDYTFNGVPDPTLVLVRGCAYSFNVDTPGHPFLIKSIQGVGAGNTYNDGVINNGASVGLITWDVPMAAPDTLFYNCEFHGGMTGEFMIIDPP